VHVIATAGHVDHGKSTLVRALTGMEPDRWAEERRRGMTIDLGFAWTTISGETFAFVDVPGHERFVPNMLAGVGPVPAALVVVAADEGWMPQTAEHVAALDALGVRHAVLAVTRSDLADPQPVIADVVRRLARTSLGDVGAVAVAVPPDGVAHGLEPLRAALVRMAHAIPRPDRAAPVRLWVDRSFTVQGSGTVVTGTLAAGTLRSNATLLLGSSWASSWREVRVRGLQSLGRPVELASALARVAVNLRGVEKDDVRRGDALLTPGSWSSTETIDVRLTGEGSAELHQEAVLHVGSAAVAVRIRPLAADVARLTLATPLPLRRGDIALLRDPGRHRILAGARILDAAPPRLARRGAAAARGRELADASDSPDVRAELRRRGIARVADLRTLGLAALPAPFAGDWLVDDARARELRDRLRAVVAEHLRRFPLATGPTVDAVRHALDLPDRVLVAALVETDGSSSLAVRDGRVIDTRRLHALPSKVAEAIAAVADRLADDPFAAPEASELTRLGLGARELAAAERAGAVVRIADGVVLLPQALPLAVDRLAALPQPFTVSLARQALQTSRRVAVPLLEMLDRLQKTKRLPDGSRVMTLSPVEGSVSVESAQRGREAVADGGGT
jgi:selenocysteine-specific elongation factor